MNRKLLKLIAHHASELTHLLEEHPELSGYADNELGKQSLANLLEELFEVGYHAEMMIEDPL